MKGIFYCEDVHSIGLLQKIIPVSQALSEEQIEAPLESAYDMFVRPLLTDNLGDYFHDVLEKSETENFVIDPTSLKALSILQRAVANLAFWYSFTELNTHITDQGFQRSEGETFKPIYRYQELELKQQFRNKGFNALDEFLQFMEAKRDFFSGYIQSPSYIDMQHSLVKGAKEIDTYYFVNGSYLVFLKLRPAFRRIMDIYVEPVVGTEAIQRLYDYLKGNIEDAEECEHLEALRERVAAVVICKALAEHVRNVGSITDRGLYYTNIQAGQNEIQNDSQASDGERARQAANLQDTADHYLHRLIRWVETNMPKQFKGHPEEAYNRDNDRKHTFWA